MTVIAIHQPNYLPWLGYFHKLANADVLIFLDDVQYSKNNYINRVLVKGAGKERWLTVPVSQHLGDTIREVRPSDTSWRNSHLNKLRSYYHGARAFDAVWPWIAKTLTEAPSPNIAALNQYLIEKISSKLGVDREFRRSSEMSTGDLRGVARLIALLRAIDPKGVYLSGRGGARYQDEAAFAAAGLDLVYTNFEHPVYEQMADPFTPGLSIVDPLFHLGWDCSRELLQARASSA